MKKNRLILAAAACLVSTVTVAESRVGDTTQQWLELQKSGAQAPADARPLSGEIAARNWQRYLKSFEQEIPQEFETGIQVRSQQ